MAAEKIVKELKCYLSDEELRELGDRLARLAEKKQGLDEEKKKIAKQYGNEIAELDDEIFRVSRVIIKKTEIRPVECEIISDFDKKEVVVVRTDTWEPVESRRMTADELQGKLFDEDGDRGEYGPGTVVEQFPDGSGFTVAGSMAKDFVEDVREEGGGD